jgi:hypothetical protein
MEVYFAKLKKSEIGAELEKRVNDYYRYIRNNGLMDLWRKCFNQYYKANLHLGNVLKNGENNEYSYLFINHFRSIIQAMLSITIAQRPAFDARAINNDYKSQTQTKLAQGLLDYYMREKRMERYISEAAELSLWSGEGYMIENWDVNSGTEYMVDDNGKPVKDGDIVFNSCAGIDMIRHPYLRNFDDRTWLIWREWANKYELAERYPDMADDILKTDTTKNNLLDDFTQRFKTEDRDIISRYRFYHEKTDAIPNGRYTEFIEGGVILFDGELPYPKIPIYHLHAGKTYGGPFAYGVSFDMLPIQEAIDGLNSAIQSNQETFAVQNIAMPIGSNIGVEQIAGGLNIILYDPKLGEPKGLNLTSTPAEIFNQRDNLVQSMESLSGINSVVRGNPEASLKSGAALALVASQSIQFMSIYQQRYTQLLEDSGTGVIEMLKQYATVPRIATIVGVANSTYMKEFKSDDLENVSRIIVDVGNPLSKTTAGKVQVADSLMQYGMIKTPEHYFQVITNGRLDNIIDPASRQQMLIAQENELLQLGENPPILITDDPVLHIQGHKQLLDSPEARKDPTVVRAVLSHIQGHINDSQTADPSLYAILGYPPPPPPMMPPMMPGQGQPSPPQGSPSPAPSMNAENQLLEQGQSVRLPSMPVNPMTGEQYSNPSGNTAPDIQQGM